MKLKDLPFSLLSADEVHTSAGRINQVVLDSGVADPYIEQVRPPLHKSMQALSTAIGSSRASVFTRRLADGDGQRDARFVGFRDYSQAFIYHPDPEKSAAASLLVRLIQNRDWSLHRLGYAVETSQLNGLLNDLQSPEARASIKTIGAETWVTDLEEAQKAFEKLYQEKIDAESKEDYPLISEARKKVIRYLEGLLIYIDMMAELKPETYEPIAVKIDEVIVDVVAVARARRTRKEND
jgi:hypothetical protein